MNSQKAKEIADYIFMDIFSKKSIHSLTELKRMFAFDIPMANRVICALSHENTWSFSQESEMIASQKAIADKFKRDEWMKKQQPLNSIKDVLRAWKQINYITGEKYINSREVSESDGIYSSVFVYHSVSVFDSKNIIFSYKVFDNNYMLASRDNSSCTLGIRVKESIYCSSCFEVSWSNKVSRSMFIHDGFDLYECLFCSHLRSKKYCIANMQFGKDEYFRVKKMVIDWILEK
ncbi:hypothetical protein HY214_04165 [Candidatus Roizmanbacteria bacterium]|nr:hypothetical protein [Candidatus Roizmanbacteria bacterium]